MLLLMEADNMDRLTLHDLNHSSRCVHRLHTFLGGPNRVRFSETLIRPDLLPLGTEMLLDLDILDRR